MTTQLAIHPEVKPVSMPLPQPRSGPIAIRHAVLSDVKFVDDLQRKHSRMVGWFPTTQLETNIAKGKVLIAEEGSSQEAVGSSAPPTPNAHCPLPTPLGYCISNDRYFKRDDCGIVYQLNVVPDKQRGLIGASLIKAVLARAAYGCKLFCCWCAQDLQANHFWESLGFVPLAFRTGSRIAGSKKTPRIHIFWQRRIREGDVETPYWFPAETSGGAVKENRLVLPIPPGTHWSDAKPAILPGMENVNVGGVPPGASDPSSGGVKKVRTPKIAVRKPPSRPKGGLWFAPAPPQKGSPEAKAAQKAEKSGGPKREKFRHDPKVVEGARELRDRYLEEINGDRMLPSGKANGKYDVSRRLDAAPTELKGLPLLEAA